MGRAIEILTEPTESDIKRDICEWLAKFPDRILFTVSPPRRGKYQSKHIRVGWPDISGIRTSPGIGGCNLRPFFIEVKKPGGTLGIEQHKILEQAKAMGAITCVATSVEDVRKALGI